jgi:type VI secretion system protein ImpF
MAELTPQERLQPSLLDRLTDNEREKRQESREKRVLSLPQLRECVLRDLQWLLNTGSLATTDDLENYPLVASSVLNYGMPDLAGHSVSSADTARIERVVRQAIWDFEPRILRDSVKVHVIVAEEHMNRNAMTFEIEGELWAQPVPLQLYLKTEIDLETGAVSVSESSPGSR